MFKSSLTFIFFWALLHLFCVCNQVPLAWVVCMGWTLSHLCCTCTHQLQMCNELFKPLISALPFCIYIYIFNIQIYLYIKYEYTHTHTYLPGTLQCFLFIIRSMLEPRFKPQYFLPVQLSSHCISLQYKCRPVHFLQLL